MLPGRVPSGPGPIRGTMADHQEGGRAAAISAQMMPRQGDLIAGRYRVEAILGKGGMGAVYRAVHEGSGRPVAVKWMLPSATADESAIERFLAEARTMARIEHANVVQILDMGEERGAPFLVMELLRGESLRQRLAKRGRLGVAEAVDLLLPAMRGVAEAHREGIVHRDLKPDNIFLCETKDGRPKEAKVVDFGISKLAESSHASGPVTKTGVAIGTPAYMSPHQLNAPKVVDPRFDVYAMGIVLYECITGRVPYDAEGLIELCMQIASGNATPPSHLAPDVTPQLEWVVLTAMRARAEERFQAMDDLVRALEELRPSLVSSAASMAPFTPQGVAVTPMPATTPMPGHGSGPVLRGTPHPVSETPQPEQPVQSTTPYQVPVAPPQSSMLPKLIGGALALVLFGAIAFAVGWWGLSDDEPMRVVSTPETPRAPEPTAPEPTAPEPTPVPAPVADPQPAPAGARYADLAGSPAEHQGAEVSLSGSVAQRDSSSFLIFVAEEGCGGARACALHVGGAPLVPPMGQAVRVHGRVDGTHAYRTRGGEDRVVPHVAADRLELLRAIDAPAIDAAERPEEARAARPSERPQITPTPLVPHARPVAPQRPTRPVVSADEI
jgi:serine/threonine protein kinase